MFATNATVTVSRRPVLRSGVRPAADETPVVVVPPTRTLLGMGSERTEDRASGTWRTVRYHRFRLPLDADVKSSDVVETVSNGLTERWSVVSVLRMHGVFAPLTWVRVERVDA